MSAALRLGRPLELGDVALIVIERAERSAEQHDSAPLAWVGLHPVALVVREGGAVRALGLEEGALAQPTLAPLLARAEALLRTEVARPRHSS